MNSWAVFLSLLHGGKSKFQSLVTYSLFEEIQSGLVNEKREKFEQADDNQTSIDDDDDAPNGWSCLLVFILLYSERKT